MDYMYIHVHVHAIYTHKSCLHSMNTCSLIASFRPSERERRERRGEGKERGSTETKEGKGERERGKINISTHMYKLSF